MTGITLCINFLSTQTKASAVKLNKVKVSETLILRVGQQKKLTVKNIPKNTKIRYQSFNKKVASVNKAGMIKDRKRGNAVIKVLLTSNKKTIRKTCHVEVYNPIRTIEPNFSSLELDVGETGVVDGYTIPSTAYQLFSYSILDDTVASINANGKIKAKKEGTTYAIIRALDGSKKYCRVLVQVYDPEKTEIKPTQSEVYQAFKKFFSSDSFYYEKPKYCFWDINQDGIPECYVEDADDAVAFHPSDLYVYENGEIISIPANSSTHSVQFSMDTQSILCNWNGGSNTGYDIYKINETGLYLERSLSYSDSPESLYWCTDNQEATKAQYKQLYNKYVASTTWENFPLNVVTSLSEAFNNYQQYDCYVEQEFEQKEIQVSLPSNSMITFSLPAKGRIIFPITVDTPSTLSLSMTAGSTCDCSLVLLNAKKVVVAKDSNCWSEQGNDQGYMLSMSKTLDKGTYWLLIRNWTDQTLNDQKLSVIKHVLFE